MEVKDIFLAPIYLLFLYMVALYARPFVTDAQDRKYYMLALSIKMFGALMFALIFIFYYHGGDTYNYFVQADALSGLFWKQPATALRIMFGPKIIYDPIASPYLAKVWWYGSPPEFFVIRVAALCGILSFSCYTCTTFFFSFISFAGVWSLFRSFKRIYPNLIKEMAIAVLMIPSVWFWGSPLMKDSLCLGALGFLFTAFHDGLILRRRIVRSLLLGSFCAFCLMQMKPYIFLSFMPPAMLWVFLEYGERVQSQAMRVLLKPLLIIAGVITAAFGTTKLTEGDSHYDINNLGQRTKITADYIYRMGKEHGSAYKLGELDGTLGGMLKLAPQAVNVTLFRPYLWEVDSIIQLMTAVEALGFFFLTIGLLFRTGIFKTIRMIGAIPLANFCFIFSLIFAFAVGINSNNFGTLARYKIQMMPFYLAGLYIARYHAEQMRSLAAHRFAIA